jgi:TRAP-type C4-dicarboxylate transport system permease small subunit
MSKLTERITQGLAHSLVTLMGVMVLTVTWQVFSRFVLNDPSSVTEELASYLLIWISLLGAAYAYRMGAHLGVDVITRSLAAKREGLVRWIVGLSAVVFAGMVLVYGGLSLVEMTLELEQVSAALQIPTGYVYLVLPLSGILIIWYAIDDLISGRNPSGEAALS